MVFHTIITLLIALLNQAATPALVFDDYVSTIMATAFTNTTTLLTFMKTAIQILATPPDSLPTLTAIGYILVAVGQPDSPLWPWVWALNSTFWSEFEADTSNWLRESGLFTAPPPRVDRDHQFDEVLMGGLTNLLEGFIAIIGVPWTLANWITSLFTEAWAFVRSDEAFLFFFDMAQPGVLDFSASWRWRKSTSSGEGVTPKVRVLPLSRWIVRELALTRDLRRAEKARDTALRRLRLVRSERNGMAVELAGLKSRVRSPTVTFGSTGRGTASAVPQSPFSFLAVAPPLFSTVQAPTTSPASAASAPVATRPILTPVTRRAPPTHTSSPPLLPPPLPISSLLPPPPSRPVRPLPSRARRGQATAPQPPPQAPGTTPPAGQLDDSLPPQSTSGLAEGDADTRTTGEADGGSRHHRLPVEHQTPQGELSDLDRELLGEKETAAGGSSNSTSGVRPGSSAGGSAGGAPSVEKLGKRFSNS